MVTALVVIAGIAIAVPVLFLYYAGHPSSSWRGGVGRSYGGRLTVFDWYSLISIGGAFIIGGLLGFALARAWWSTLALYVFGFAFVLWLGPFIVPWFFWIFGVSAGSGVRGLVQRRRRLRASFLRQPG